MSADLQVMMGPSHVSRGSSIMLSLMTLLLATSCWASPAGKPRIFERPLGAQDLSAGASSLWPAATRASAAAFLDSQPKGALDRSVPIVDAKRVAGYFLLDRTKEAQMFYFLFRSRSKDTDPLVLWMTGASFAYCTSWLG